MKDRTFFTIIGLVTAAWLALCCWGIARCDDTDAARSRLKAIESERAEAAAVAAAKAKAASELPEPVPDPISRKPSIHFQSVVAGDVTPRLPRGVLVVGMRCSPCLRMEQENAELIGGKDAPIELVKNWLANDLEELGIMPSMLQITPTLFIIGADGKVHGLTAKGLGCTLQGYQSPKQIRDYLQAPEHAVSVEPLTKPPVIANVEQADSSPETYAAALSAHLLESSGQHQGEPFLYGRLFDLTIDVPESWKSIGLKLLTTQKLEFPVAGLTVDWSGPSRSFAIAKTKLTITPPVKVSVKKWLLSYTAALDGIEFGEQLSSVTLLLTGAPDLTVILK